MRSRLFPTLGCFPLGLQIGCSFGCFRKRNDERVRSALSVTCKSDSRERSKCREQSLATDWLRPLLSFSPLTLNALPAGKRRCKAELREVGVSCSLAEEGKAVTPLPLGKPPADEIKPESERIRVTAQPRSRKEIGEDRTLVSQRG